MENKPKIFCVISHTHWDREWYAPLELFRNRLTDLFDRLLKILDENPDYVFHMDSQTVVLEDYLAVRPEKKEILREHIKNRRIMVGPWYLQNDFYLTSGEATVRNLLEGDKLCAEFGQKGGIGYAPDQFGNISQLPQILDNFGIHNFVFGRGFSEYYRDKDGNIQRKPSPTEFKWKGADGTECLAIHMRHWYNNAQRFSENIDKAMKFLKGIEDCFDNEFTLTPYLLLMNGVDHLEPQANLLPVLGKMQERLPENQYIMQYNFDDYIADVEKYIADNDVKLSVHEGELRSGHDWEILKGTLSSRHYIKVANCRAQAMLENRLEPLYAMMERDGMKGSYPADRLRYTWKNLMRNHPHDSICGCSRDEVHAHMENRYDEIFEYGNDLIRRGMTAAAYHSKALRDANLEDYIVTVANTLSTPWDGMAEVTMKFVEQEEFNNFEILDEDGNAVPFMVNGKHHEWLDVFSPINLPGTLDVTVYHAYVNVGHVEPFSFKSFRVVKKDGDIAQTPVKCCDAPSISNEFFTVDVDAQGKVAITDKRTARVIDDAVKFEDVADAGESYVFVTGGDQPVYSDGMVTGVAVTEKNDYVQTIEISYRLELPADYDRGAKKRTAEMAVSDATITLSLKKGQKWVDLKYRIDNKSKCHRLRVFFKTDVTNDVSTADIPFDVVTHGEEAHYLDTFSKVLPNTSFAALQKDGKGFAVMNTGAHEYEHLSGNCLAFSVIRANGKISENAADTWTVPGNQCLRVIEGEMGIAPFAGDVISAGIPQLTQQFRAPLLATHTSADTRKFEGGRPCVQDSDLSEFFYLPDEYPQVGIPSNVPAITVDGEGIQVTAFKRSEDGSGLILRVVNLADSDRVASIAAAGKIFKTTMAEKRREFVSRDKADFTLGSKKILTLFLD